MGLSNSYVWYDYYVHRTHLVDDNPWIMGDAQFMVLFDKVLMTVWTMEEVN